MFRRIAIAGTLALALIGCGQKGTTIPQRPSAEEDLQERINDLHTEDTELWRYGPLMDCLGIEKALPAQYDRFLAYVVVNANGFPERHQEPAKSAETPYARVELPFSRAQEGYSACKAALNPSDPEAYQQTVEDLLSGKLDPGDY